LWRRWRCCGRPTTPWSLDPNCETRCFAARSTDHPLLWFLIYPINSQKIVSLPPTFFIWRNLILLLLQSNEIKPFVSLVDMIKRRAFGKYAIQIGIVGNIPIRDIRVERAAPDKHAMERNYPGNIPSRQVRVEAAAILEHVGHLCGIGNIPTRKIRVESLATEEHSTKIRDVGNIPTGHVRVEGAAKGEH
jgi:hypothetical protein